MGRVAYHDLDRPRKPTAGPVYELARIAAVRKDPLQSAKPRTQWPNQELGLVDKSAFKLPDAVKTLLTVNGG